MKSLGTLAWGMLLIVIDIRVDQTDVVPDPVGWAVALVALWPLARLHQAYAVASLACVVGLAVSLPGMFEPAQGALAVGELVAQTGLVVATCTGIAATVDPLAARARLIRAWGVGITVAVLIVVLAANADSSLVPLALVGVVAVLAVVVCFLVLLWQSARHPAPAGSGGASRGR